jgi:hypothetical protein
MNKEEEILYDFIKSKLPKNVSFIHVIADVLDISYDSAYRRVKGSTILSMKEALQLSNHFKFNLNDLVNSELETSNTVLIEKSHTVISDDFMSVFFEKSNKEIKEVLNSKKGQVIHCAKDFPFYHSTQNAFKEFRLYLFINFISSDKSIKKVPFSEFKPSKKISEKYDLFLDYFSKVSLIEIWNNTTIDNVLNQILYFFEVGLTTKKEAVSIADGLIDCLISLENQAKKEKRDNNSSKNFHLYHNNLISLLNSVLMKTDYGEKVFLPYTNLKYLIISDKNTSKEIKHHIKTQLEFSNNLSGESTVSRKKFFNEMYQKVEKLKLKLLL